MENKKKLIIGGIVFLIAILIGLGIFFMNQPKKYTIDFDTNGGESMNEVELKDGSTIGDIEEPTREGYTFLYWTYEGKICEKNDKITKNMHLIAIWKADKDTKVEKYKITFNTDGGDKIESQEVEEGNVVIKPKDPTKEGYKFEYWELDGKEYDFKEKVKKNLELKAKWKKVVKYTVSFNTNGGSSVANQTVEEGEKANKPGNPTKNGYKFIEWTLNGNKYDFNTKVINNITLVAKWEKVNTGTTNSTQPTTPTNPSKPTVKKYTVTFNSNGGSAVASQTVTEGAKASRPANPARSGYTFTGWTLNGASYNFNSPVNSNITLMATWKKIEVKNYTVTFNSNGGSAVASQTVSEGGKATQPSNPVKSGYTFNGWTLNGTAYNFNSPVAGNITLVANWTQKSYTIGVSLVDAYSPDRILTVYENGTKINVSSIKYTDGVQLCSGANTTVTFSDIEGESSFIVVLSDGTQVTATLR